MMMLRLSGRLTVKYVVFYLVQIQNLETSSTATTYFREPLLWYLMECSETSTFITWGASLSRYAVDKKACTLLLVKASNFLDYNHTILIPHD